MRGRTRRKLRAMRNIRARMLIVNRRNKRDLVRFALMLATIAIAMAVIFLIPALM